MEDKEAIEVLKRIEANSSLSDEERSALRIAIGFMTLATHTSERWIKKMKDKRDAGLDAFDPE
jgi:hypothetical protein